MSLGGDHPRVASSDRQVLASDVLEELIGEPLIGRTIERGRFREAGEREIALERIGAAFKEGWHAVAHYLERRRPAELPLHPVGVNAAGYVGVHPDERGFAFDEVDRGLDKPAEVAGLGVDEHVVDDDGQGKGVIVGDAPGALAAWRWTHARCDARAFMINHDPNSRQCIEWALHKHWIPYRPAGSYR